MLDGLTIGDLAGRCGVSRDTLRFYERQRLLSPRRSASGYRLYGETDAARVRFIRRAQATGLTLDDIRELLRVQKLATPETFRRVAGPPPGADRGPRPEDRGVRLQDRIRGVGQGTGGAQEDPMTDSDCCQVETPGGAGPARCADCDQPGRTVDPITVKALLRPEALARRSAPAHRFCPTPSCPVVYFGEGEVFDREEVGVPVFQKEPAGDRTVCYCFAISEGDLRREIAETDRSTATQRITEHVRAGRCACEVRNPQGSCCLGNVAAAVKALGAPDELAEL